MDRLRLAVCAEAPTWSPCRSLALLAVGDSPRPSSPGALLIDVVVWVEKVTAWPRPHIELGPDGHTRPGVTLAPDLSCCAFHLGPSPTRGGWRRAVIA